MIDFAATAPAGSNVARNDSTKNAASERLVIAITKRFNRFSCESGLIDPEWWQVARPASSPISFCTSDTCRVFRPDVPVHWANVVKPDRLFEVVCWVVT